MMKLIKIETEFNDIEWLEKIGFYIPKITNKFVNAWECGINIDDILFLVRYFKKDNPVFIIYAINEEHEKINLDYDAIRNLSNLFKIIFSKGEYNLLFEYKTFKIKQKIVIPEEAKEILKTKKEKLKKEIKKKVPSGRKRGRPKKNV